jgi:predicted Zn-dependent protease
MHGGKRLGAALLVTASLLGPSAALAQARPAGLQPAVSSPEGGLWDLMDKAEAQVKRSAELNTDPALNAYVRQVACKVASEYCSELRVYVLDRPFFNATMAPNGYTEVWSGLLLRCQDEAELAYVLGHETSHFAENHSIEQHNAHKSRMNVALALSVGVAVAGAVAASSAYDAESAQAMMESTGNLIDVIYLSAVAGYFRFSRGQESEADLLGLRRAAAAGYRSSAAADSWRGLMAETSSSQFERKRKQDAKLGIFDTHPLSIERIKALEAEAAKLSARGEESGRERYRAAIRPFLPAWLKDDLRRRDFGETLHLLDQLARFGEDKGILDFYRGETFRLRGGDGDLVRARDSYLSASTQADAPVVVWRELGEAQRRTGQVGEARASLQTYLERASGAEDAWIVRDTLDSLSKGG